MSLEYTKLELSPVYTPFFGVMGASAAMIFTGFFHSAVLSAIHPCSLSYIFILFLALGAAYGTAKSGTGIAAMAVMRPELIMKSIIPVVMAGIIAIYGLVVAVIIAQKIKQAPDYTLFQ